MKTLLFSVTALAMATMACTGGADEETGSEGQQVSTQVIAEIAQVCGAGAWQDTTNLDGFAGTYDASGAGELAEITFTQTKKEGFRSEGTYAARAGRSAESTSGAYEAAGFTAAFPYLILAEGQPSVAEAGKDANTYMLLAVERGPSVERVCMRLMHSPTQAEAPTLLTRRAEKPAPQAQDQR